MHGAVFASSNFASSNQTINNFSTNNAESPREIFQDFGSELATKSGSVSNIERVLRGIYLPLVDDDRAIPNQQSNPLMCPAVIKRPKSRTKLPTFQWERGQEDHKLNPRVCHTYSEDWDQPTPDPFDNGAGTLGHYVPNSDASRCWRLQPKITFCRARK